MRRIIILNYFIGISTFLMSCSKAVDITDYIDSGQSLRLFNVSDSVDILNRPDSILTPHDIRYSMLLKWGKANVNDWESTPLISYLTQYGVSQKDFSLSVINESVIVNIRSEQFVKKIEKDELLFLLDSMQKGR